jgi:hypothetical protein
VAEAQPRGMFGLDFASIAGTPKHLAGWHPSITTRKLNAGRLLSPVKHFQQDFCRFQS